MTIEKSSSEAQLEFFKANRSGCAFAAVAARDPEHYGWFYQTVNLEAKAIDNQIKVAIDTPQVSTMSLIFTDTNSPDALLALIKTFQQCDYVFLEQNILYEGYRCLGFRVRVGELTSWVSGFGNFEFFPPTRRTPYTEIIFRVKRRPDYKKVMKKTLAHIIHLADMYMLGIADNVFRQLWRSSLERTAKIIGHKPDLRSAAKTTFAIPENFEI